MFETIFPLFNFYPTYAQKLVDDIPDEQLCAQPVAGQTLNHAAFILGHLAWANDRAVTMALGKPSNLPAQWAERFAMGVTPSNDRSDYPSKAELLATLNAAHAWLGQAVAEATEQQLSTPAPDRMRSRFPTIRHMLAGLMTGHYASHLGQLSAWRRAMGFKSVF